VPEKFDALLHEQTPRNAAITITEGMNQHETVKKFSNCL
jgi:hypothetical protein